jgi:hypothetical protein
MMGIKYYGIHHRDTGLWFLGFNGEGESLWGSIWHHRAWGEEDREKAWMQSHLLSRACEHTNGSN